MRKDAATTGWTRYGKQFCQLAPRPSKGGTASVRGDVSLRVVRVAFGFQRQAEEWGEAAWTARDLR